MKCASCFSHFRDEIVDSQDGEVTTTRVVYVYTYTHTDRCDIKYKPGNLTLSLPNNER